MGELDGRGRHVWLACPAPGLHERSRKRGKVRREGGSKERELYYHMRAARPAADVKVSLTVSR